MKTLRTAVLAGVLIAALGWPRGLLAGSDITTLPPAAVKVLRAHFPGAKVTEIGRERERGAWYYEVDLEQAGGRVSVEVTADGVIGEIEARVDLRDVPPTILGKLRQRVGDGKITRIERHERRGIARSGTFVRLATPRILYEVKYLTRDGSRRDVQVASDEIAELPKEVLARLAASVPGARVAEAEVEDDDGVLLFVLTLVRNGERSEVVADRQGRVVESETPVPTAEVPAALAAAVAANRDIGATDATEILKRETFAAVEGGALVPRRSTAYAVRVRRGERQREFLYDAEGRITSASDWESTRDDDSDEDDDK
jgi:uncharacterized membrane protein YkoI